MKRSALYVTLIVSVNTGCGDPLDLGQVIERTRPIGMRVRVDADPERAWPRPGEGASAEWLVVSPSGSRAVSWTLSACATENFDGPPVCSAPAFATATADSATSGVPVLPFVVPADAGASVRFAVVGAVCEVDSGNARACSEEDPDSFRVSADLFVEHDEDTNHNPNLDDDVIEIDGSSWPAAAPVSCDDPAAFNRRVSRGAATVRVRFGSGDREALAAGESLADDAREALTVSHFSTHGELERQFSVVEGNDPTPEPIISVEWKPPETVATNGELVRFYFVARDGRGGTDWTERALCLVR